MDDCPFDSNDFPKRYELKSLIGQGGMGFVFHAYDQQLMRDVAIKVLSIQGQNDAEAQERFLREAKALALLDHPNLVRIFSSGINEKGYPFYVMEFLQGESLASELSRGRMQADRFFEIFAQLLAGLEHAHSKRIAHRDLKPSNIMICLNSDGQDSSCKIIDFGIARIEPTPEQTERTLTRTDSLLGSPLYMSPEQCRGQRGDYKSDIYMLGCIMHECITGEPPFRGDNAIGTMYKHMAEVPPDLSTMAKSASSKQLAVLVSRCLAKDPAERPASLAEIQTELKTIIGSGAEKLDLFYRQLNKSYDKRKIVTIASTVLVLLAVAVLGTEPFLSKQNRSSSVIRTEQQKKVEEKIASSKAKLNSDKILPPAVQLKNLFTLGRLQLMSARAEDLSDAEATYTRALSLCQENQPDRKAACLTLRGKSKLKLGRLVESDVDMTEAEKLIKSIQGVQGNDLWTDFIKERCLLRIHQRRYLDQEKDFDRGSVLWLANHHERDFDLIKVSDQRLDPQGEVRNLMIRTCEKELQTMRPLSEKEATEMISLSNRITRILIDKDYRQPKFVGADALDFAEYILNDYVKTPSLKTPLKLEIDQLRAQASR